MDCSQIRPLLLDFCFSRRHPLFMAQIITLSSRSPAQLAPEVHAMIIDDLRNSKRDLSVCSVVCKCWLPLCRRHLFSKVNYRPDFANFITSSAHAISTISPYIRKITIKENLLVTAEKNTATEFILNLPHLQSLKFEKSDWNNLQSRISLPFGKTLFWAQLTALYLRSVHIPSFIELVSLIESFTSLQDLSLDSVSWDRLGCISDEENSISFRNSTILPSTLRRIHIAFCHNIVILNWLQYGVMSDSILERKMTGRKTCRPFPKLSVLSLPDIQPAEAQTLGLFLATVGDSLERFEVGVLSNFQAFSSTLDLSSNTRLRTVVIHQITLFRFPFLVERDEATHSSNSVVLTSPYGWLPNLLSSIQSTNLFSIQFCIWLSDQSQLDAFPWNLLCEVLVNIGVPHIHLTISGIGRDMDSVRRWFMERLGKLDRERTAIDFEFTG